MSDLRERVPAQSLIEKLLDLWAEGSIRRDQTSRQIVIDPEVRSWYRGVFGERHIATLLDQLGPDWMVLHSVPVGAGKTDIDHVAIGPGGVFTINTKYSPGRTIWAAGFGLRVDNQAYPYVNRSISEADNASAALSKAVGFNVPVAGVLVFVTPARMSRTAPCGNSTTSVLVASDDELLHELQFRNILSSGQIERISEAALKPSTWHSSPAPSGIGAHLLLEFEALEAELGTEEIVPRESLHAPRRATRSTTRQAPGSRSGATPKRASSPAATRTRSRGKKEQSSAEKLLSVLFPIAGFIIVAAYLSNLGH